MKKRVTIIVLILLAVLSALLGLKGCHGTDEDPGRTIVFRDDALWVYESRPELLDPLTLVQFPEGVRVSPEQIDLRIVGKTTVTFYRDGDELSGISREVCIIEPLITLIKPTVYLNIGDQYDPEENVISSYDHQCSPVQIDTSRPQSLTVTVRAQSEDLVSEKSFEVIISADKMVWVIDQPYQPAQIIDVWIVDRPAVSERGHWEVVEAAVEEQGHYENVEIPEQGHWEEVTIKPEVPEQGHWEKIHHDAVTHQKPIYEQYKYWLFEFSDGFSIKVYQYELAEMGLTATQYAVKYEDSHPGVTGRWHSEIEKRLVGYETVIDQPAYDEEVWVVDVAFEPAVTERRWIVDQPAHQQRRWIVDVPARPEKKQWIIDQPAQPEEGHWEQRLIAEVPEQGHWERSE